MKKFNESKFTNYLSSLIDDFNNPSTEYDKGAFETLKRIINEFEADHYDQD
ncbi:leucyl aminopeptidase [Lactobacillus taiwanensis]|uniref:leucyl aminopeptidase n=1 Tax=Lactobacillus taiwanensis TaxID=508451 RepID=UPI00129EAA2A|nr:leucyl aminopeptidase [Lactobacillus taiwanensis]MRM99453.1 leucyl aminopeptidase [Lactobacillus taiwanensis]